MQGRTYRSAQPLRTVKEAKQAAAKTAYAILKEQEKFSKQMEASGEGKANNNYLIGSYWNKHNL